MNSIVAIIQARMTSTRLPGKVLADIGGKPLLHKMIERVSLSKKLSNIIVATTINADDDPVEELCKQLNVSVYRGDEEDVLGRFSAAAKNYSAEDIIVRLTADCPLIDPEIIDQTIEVYERKKCDYASNTNVRTYPDGLDVEVFSRDILELANKNAKHTFLREHVTPYIRGSHAEYGCVNLKIEQLIFPGDFSHIRWTVDTAEDLEVIREIFKNLPEQFNWLQALSLCTHKPHLFGAI
jgi:spore coat polysaccharide biosynthesis protein SpsF (cytidylyltransferase family)